MKKAELMCHNWNLACNIGVKVEVIMDDRNKYNTKTKSKAWVLNGHTAVIMLEGISGCYKLDRVNRKEWTVQSNPKFDYPIKILHSNLQMEGNRRFGLQQEVQHFVSVGFNSAPKKEMIEAINYAEKNIKQLRNAIKILEGK